MMLWSPKLDLIALANANGEVMLHRLSWQKVWALAAPGDGETVGGLAWRPDGKVLAVGYVSVGFMIQDGSQERRVCSATITEDFHSLSVVVESTSDESDEIDYYILTFDTTLLKSRSKEIRLLALKYGMVCCLVEHLQTTIQQMSEAWEDILTEMDSKLLKFAEEKKKTGQGTVSNDFLELLLFGTPSPELQNFLLHELTDKGLKKLGYSIETSYSNIQKLVVKHLQTVSQAIVYHLSELQGMAQWYDKFGVLGLDLATMQTAIQAAGSFVISACDLQQVIDGSIKNFKAFFRWLYVVILRLSKEEIPAELSKMTQHDINFVSEFLRDNFSHFIPEESSLFAEEGAGTSAAAADKKPRFKLEKVGQYLKKEDLAHPSNMSSNPWFTDTSSNQIITVFTTNFLPYNSFYILRQPTDLSRVEEEDTIVAVTTSSIESPGHMHDTSTSSSSTGGGEHFVLDLSVYDQNTLSLLLVDDSHDGRPALAQLPLSAIPAGAYTTVNTTENIVGVSGLQFVNMDTLLPTRCLQHLAHMKAHSLAVSGPRKTATVLFHSRRRVRIFLMDEDDDEDEDGEGGGSAQPTSVFPP
nr:hypothetical protein BaRGS_026039 [Batillaria attramentaria]